VLYISTKDETVRLFKNNFLEFLTRVHPSIPVLFYLPLILWMMWRAFTISSFSYLQIGLLFLFGILTWSLAEYLLHRFVFHFRAKTKFSQKIFHLMHGIHHDYPNDSKRLVMPPIISLPVAILLLILFFGKPAWEIYAAGFGLGYLVYDMTHYMVHHFSFQSGVLLQLKQHHLRHHFQDSERGFGVSSSLWDLFFKTLFSGSSSRMISKGSCMVLFFGIFYCLFKIWMHELHPIYPVFTGIILGLYFLNLSTRTYLILALPLIIHVILFDAFRYIPFHWLQPIHIVDLYDIDQLIFGIQQNGKVLLFHEYLLRYSSTFLNLFCGLIYHIHDPVVFVLVYLFWRLKNKELAERFAVAFLLMNLFAFATYFFYPTAAPWYVVQQGFVQPLGPILGNAAGLSHFENTLGSNVSTQLYSLSPIVFGAVPSMHAGFTMLGWIYSFYVGKKFATVVGFYTVSMWFAALYLQHHYMIDLVVGIIYAFVAWMLVEKVMWKRVERTYRFLFKYFIPSSS